MRVVIAILCVFSLVLVACGDDDDEASLETFCEKNAQLTKINEELFVPPMDETPDEVETLVAEGLLVVEEMEAAAPEEIQETLGELVSFETYAEVLEANGWDVEAAGEEMDALIGSVDPNTVDEFTAYTQENCTTDAAGSDG